MANGLHRHRQFHTIAASDNSSSQGAKFTNFIAEFYLSHNSEIVGKSAALSVARCSRQFSVEFFLNQLVVKRQNRTFSTEKNELKQVFVFYYMVVSLFLTLQLMFIHEAAESGEWKSNELADMRSSADFSTPVDRCITTDEKGLWVDTILEGSTRTLHDSNFYSPKMVAQASIEHSETWAGLRIAPENRCSPYSSKSYPYSQSVERQIVDSMGQIYGPYTGRCFASTRETDIEHIVARSEAHDSGLCAASDVVRRQFSSDLLNLTIASPSVNRYQKRERDATNWLPDQNKCWYASRVLAVKLKYGLTVDRREAEVLSSVLSQCESTNMIFYECVDEPSQPEPDEISSSENTNALELWDDNHNGRITCAEARRHGIAPVTRKHPAYRYMRDGDGDGVVCE